MTQPPWNKKLALSNYAPLFFIILGVVGDRATARQRPFVYPRPAVFIGLAPARLRITNYIVDQQRFTSNDATQASVREKLACGCQHN